MRTWVLCYHSHNIAGGDYGNNDHVALAADLRMLDAMGARIVPLARVVDSLVRREVGEGPIEVALTFDDGPVFDVEDFGGAHAYVESAVAASNLAAVPDLLFAVFFSGNRLAR